LKQDNKYLFYYNQPDFVFLFFGASTNPSVLPSAIQLPLGKGAYAAPYKKLKHK